MANEKRERQKAGKAARLEAERKAEARQKTIRGVRNIVIFVVLLVIVLLLLTR